MMSLPVWLHCLVFLLGKGGGGGAARGVSVSGLSVRETEIGLNNACSRKLFITRKYSSRMHTARFSLYGGLCLGVSLTS